MGEARRMEVINGRASLALLCCLLSGVVAQFGVFDLQANSDTMMVGTTETVLPSCFSTPNGFCANGGGAVFTPDGAQNDLIAWYNFDDAFGLDHSGHATTRRTPFQMWAQDTRGVAAA